MWFYENLGSIIGGVFASGIALHFVARWRQRRRYRALRRAYEDAVREAPETDRDPATLVRAAEIHRVFMNSWLPGWFEGFGRNLRTAVKLSVALALFALFLKGPIERGEAEHATRQARAAGGEAAGR
jgi:hypothetical protein